MKMNSTSNNWALTVAAVVAVAALCWPFVFTNPFVLSITTLISLNLIGALSLHLIIRTGHISLGHAAFMGVGSYTCVLSMTLLNMPPLIALAAGVGASALLALLVGPIVLRLTGKYFVLVTFLLGEIVRLVFVEWISVTGGANGLAGVPPLHPALATPLAMYLTITVVAILVALFCARILRSELGRAIDSVREAPHVAEASGVPVLRLKVGVFVLACSLVGLQGGLLAFFLRYIDPNTFGLVPSLNFVVMNIIGGMYNMAGPMIGALFLVALPELFRDYVELQQVLFGIVLIIVMASFTGGLVEIYGKVRRAVQQRRAQA